MIVDHSGKTSRFTVLVSAKLNSKHFTRYSKHFFQLPLINFVVKVGDKNSVVKRSRDVETVQELWRQSVRVFVTHASHVISTTTTTTSIKKTSPSVSSSVTIF